MKRLTLTLAALAVAPGLMAATLLDKAADRKLDGPPRAVPGQAAPEKYEVDRWIMALPAYYGLNPVLPPSNHWGFKSKEQCDFAVEKAKEASDELRGDPPVCIPYLIREK